MAALDVAGYEGPRTPTPEEWESVLEMSRSIFFPSAASFREAAATWPMSLHPDFRANTFVLFHRGEPVSMVGRVERDIIVLGHRLRLGYIGGVATRPEHRGKGLASLALAASLHTFHQHGVDFVYISGIRPMYYGAGADHVGGFQQATIAPGSLPGPRDARLRLATREEIPLLCRLNERDAVRFVRPAGDYEQILTYGYCAGRRSEFHLVAVQGVPVGYLFVSHMAREGRKWLHVREVRGERQAALHAMGEMADASGMEVAVDLPRGDVLGDILAARGLEVRPGRTPGTVKALDFSRTMGALKPYFASHLDAGFVESLAFTEGCGRYLASSRDGALTIDGERSMLRTLLGEPEGEAVEGVTATGEMAGLLDQCLPIPWPMVYMNMI
ncbi:MAG: GNAT family N-acetyltransferase [Armatimonadetes bacterium]|nr:GNAT family N-acetyltransferase [Armatimonadota bacterium]